MKIVFLKDKRFFLKGQKVFYSFSEAVVNALAHRDYRSTANVQVYIFKDRVEIVSPGGLPAGMTEADLGFKSIPRNPLLFGMLHRMEAVEHIGSGIRRIRNLCRDYGVAEPQIEVSEHWFTLTFPRPGSRVESQQPESTPHVTPHVTKLVLSLVRDMNRDELMKIVGLKDRKYFMGSYLKPAFDAGLVEMTIPDKPRSRVQCYRLTLRGIELQQSKQERP